MVYVSCREKIFKCSNALIYKPPVDELDNYHLAKLIVYLVKQFEKENRGLFKGKAKGVPGPKFKYSTSEMLALYFFCYF